MSRSGSVRLRSSLGRTADSEPATTTRKRGGPHNNSPYPSNGPTSLSITPNIGGGNGGNSSTTRSQARTRGLDMDSSQESIQMDLEMEEKGKNSSGSGDDITSKNENSPNPGPVPGDSQNTCSNQGDETNPLDTSAMDVDNDADDSSSKSSSSSDSSDSESESELDEETYEKKKEESLLDMKSLENQFYYMREALFKERIEHIDKKLEEVKSGKAKEYLQPLEQLQENMSVRIEIAGSLKELRLESTRHKYEAEELATMQNFESDKSLLYDAIKEDLEDKIHRLEEDRNNDFTSELWLETAMKRKNKKSLDIFGEKKKKPVTITGPFIVYMLNDVDIVEDWTMIKKACAAPKRKYVEMVF